MARSRCAADLSRHVGDVAADRAARGAAVAESTGFGRSVVMVSSVPGRARPQRPVSGATPLAAPSRKVEDAAIESRLHNVRREASRASPITAPNLGPEKPARTKRAAPSPWNVRASFDLEGERVSGIWEEPALGRPATSARSPTTAARTSPTRAGSCVTRRARFWISAGNSSTQQHLETDRHASATRPRAGRSELEASSGLASLAPTTR
jgi:hypothetical protein